MSLGIYETIPGFLSTSPFAILIQLCRRQERMKELFFHFANNRSRKALERGYCTTPGFVAMVLQFPWIIRYKFYICRPVKSHSLGVWHTHFTAFTLSRSFWLILLEHSKNLLYSGKKVHNAVFLQSRIQPDWFPSGFWKPEWWQCSLFGLLHTTVGG